MDTSVLLTGNEAIARGAWQSGVQVASGYPGTPSTEILEALAEHKADLYLEWSPNEKVAFEVAAGAAMAGANSLVAMKHVGLNVASDPMMTLSYIGVEGGMVICVADDPGQHSSQNEQDSRHYARFAKLPVLEPSDSQEALDFTVMAFGISREFKVPVILRTTTRVSHSRSAVTLSGRTEGPAPGFVKNPERWVPIPLWSRAMRKKLELRYAALSAAACASPANRAEPADVPAIGASGRPRLGIVAEGIAYQYVKDIFPEAAVLKLGWAWPYPDALLRSFASGVENLVVVEENEEILEEHMLAIGIECLGRSLMSGIGEMTGDKLLALRSALALRGIVEARAEQEGGDAPAARLKDPELPGRPPVLCPGCPHRGVFHALGRHDVVVTGDIGCYSLGVFPPLSRTDAILCMGGGFSMAQGMAKAGEKRRVVGVVGDSTFFHSGITGLIDVVYNSGGPGLRKPVLIVLDNRTTAMTGHQDHPGTGRTLMGEKSYAASIEDIARACGMKNVYAINPYDMAQTKDRLERALADPEPSLIVARAPCPLRERKPVGPLCSIDQESCRSCGACLKLGCPAIESKKGGKPLIKDNLCSGCGLCAQVCAFKAISATEEAK